MLGVEHSLERGPQITTTAKRNISLILVITEQLHACTNLKNYTSLVLNLPHFSLTQINKNYYHSLYDCQKKNLSNIYDRQ